MIEKIPGVGGAKQYNNNKNPERNNLNSKKRIVYENSKNKIGNIQPKNTKIISSSAEAALTCLKVVTTKNQINSKFNRRRNFAEARQIKRSFRHLLPQTKECTATSKSEKKSNRKINSKRIKENKIRRKSSFASSSWDSIEERLNLLERFINYNYYVKSEENNANNSDDDYEENFLIVESDFEEEEDMRRGHQHHPRLSGQRKSNVVMEEDVLAALVSGSAVSSADDEGKIKYITSESSSNSSSFMDKSLDEHQFIEHSSDSLLDLNKNLEQLTTSSSSNNNTMVELEHSNESSIVDISLSATDNTKSSKIKTKSSHKKKASSRTEKSSSDKKRDKKSRNISAPDLSQTSGTPEDDLETEELAKLRCTSERAEVVAERENRRNKNRCADYPGLAFGGSIFSSDTMMKFNIIRNELHNIMKSQLKRVKAYLNHTIR